MFLLLLGFYCHLCLVRSLLVGFYCCKLRHEFLFFYLSSWDGKLLNKYIAVMMLFIQPTAAMRETAVVCNEMVQNSCTQLGHSKAAIAHGLCEMETLLFKSLLLVKEGW